MKNQQKLDNNQSIYTILQNKHERILNKSVGKKINIYLCNLATVPSGQLPKPWFFFFSLDLNTNNSISSNLYTKPKVNLFTSQVASNAALKNSSAQIPILLTSAFSLVALNKLVITKSFGINQLSNSVGTFKRVPKTLHVN